MGKNNTPIIRLAKVESVTDDQAGLRIKVRLHEDTYQDYPDISSLPYCFPLLPKFVHVNPKIGECVLVILASLDGVTDNRFFIGPVISQQYCKNYDPYLFRSRCLLKGGNSTTPYPNPEMNPDNDGSCPEREDISLQGRQNTDMILKDNEVRIRCGATPFANGNGDYTLKFNKEDLSYILMRFSSRANDPNTSIPYRTSVNIVADRINLLSHDSKNTFILNNTKKLITDEEMEKILKMAHPLPYGDELIDFLKKLIEVIRTHTHPFSMDPPCFTTPQNDVLETNLDNMLSKSIRIN